MSKISKATLMSLRDFISDALSDPEITPYEIATAIRDELKDLIVYHRMAMAQAEQTLNLLNDRNAKQDDRYNFARFRNVDTIEKIQDDLTFGKYDFKLGSDYLDNDKNNNK